MAVKGFFSGLTGAAVLGLFLKVIQSITSLKVYTLLLNIDFIYPRPLPEWIEFVLHLAVGCAVGVLFHLVLLFFRAKQFKNYLAISALLTIPAALLYFPLSLFSIKEVPSITNLTAFLFWAIGHLLFSITMASVQYHIRKA